MVTNGVERRYRVEAVQKALRLLDAFAAPPHRFGLTDLGARSGLSTNQTFRLLHTLVEAGFVRQEGETKLYRLGPRLFGLVGALLHGDDLLVAARETLRWANEETGETVALITPDGDDGTVCVDVRESTHPLLVAEAVGTRSDHLHAGACWKVFLAALDDAAVELFLATHLPLAQLTAHTPTTADAVWAEVRAARAQGYAVSDQEVAEGMYGIAAPVRDRQGEVAAAVILAAPVARAGPADRERHRAVVVEASRRVSNNLGFRAEASLG